MLLGGDEIGRSQGGNNNGYCQDNEVSWFDWRAVDAELLDYTRRLIHHRLAHPVFRRRRWFEGAAIRGGAPDIAWFTPQGNEMSEQDWQAGFAKSLCIFLNGQAIRSPGPQGRADRGPELPAALQRPPRAGRVSPAGAMRTALAEGARHRRVDVTGGARRFSGRRSGDRHRAGGRDARRSREGQRIEKGDIPLFLPARNGECSFSKSTGGAFAPPCRQGAGTEFWLDSVETAARRPHPPGDRIEIPAVFK
jgi:hypothetical protein